MLGSCRDLVRRRKTTPSLSYASYLLPGILASALFACTTPAQDGPSFATRDSAGIVIAENQGAFDAGSSRWALSPEPVLEIGALDGEEAYLFDRIAGAVRLSDGSLAVLDSRACNLKIFDPTGRHLRTMGTQGEGPGEFRSPRQLGLLPGDTLLVADTRLRRISLFHPVDGFIRSSTADAGIQGYLLTVGMFSSGTLLSRRTVFGEDRTDGFSRQPVHFRSLAPDGSLETDFGEFVGEEVVMVTQADGPMVNSISGDAPFAKGAQVAVGGDRFYYSSQDRYEIQVWSRSGTLERIIRADREPEPVTQEQVDALLEEGIEGLPDSDLARKYRRTFEASPIPAFHPAHGALYLDTGGFLLVEETRVSDDLPRVLSVFDPEGRIMASLDLPDDLTILEIGEDYLLARGTDDLGVQYLRKYGLTRSVGPEVS